jgi:cob(I)alamin adenosyltransferase
MNAHYKEILIEIQDRLFTVGAILAPPEKEVKKNGELRLKKLGIIESDIELENEIDSMENALPYDSFCFLEDILLCHIVI